MKKYEITDIAHPDNPDLHRIRAVTDLTEDVLKGMLGGYGEADALPEPEDYEDDPAAEDEDGDELTGDPEDKEGGV